MTKNSSFQRTVAALRDLDPAAATTLTENERERASATLARIVATPRSDSDWHAPIPRSRRRPVRALVSAGLVAAATVVAVAVPTLLGGQSAFASWTAAPSPLSPSNEQAAMEACLANIDLDADDARVVIAEQRGEWTYILIEGRGEGYCLMPDSMIVGEEIRADGFTGSYDPERPKAPTLPRDGIYEAEATESTVSSDSRVPFSNTDNWYSLVVGYAGSDVTAVTVHPPSGPAVEASLVDGRYAAWWPGGEVSGDNPDNGKGWTYTVTLTDGTRHEVGGRP
ncbi:hypothetical protein [Nocardioides sp. GCM10030258]|uniref:hypothetical protein n=1 Tax=unclassified Nocardioides TaxID=2615069 RepID=UPI003621881D